MRKNINNLKSEIKKILRQNHIDRAGIFGSYARGEETSRSDIDILIEFRGSLLALVRLEKELQKRLGKKVDILTYKGISPFLRKRILREEVRIL